MRGPHEAGAHPAGQAMNPADWGAMVVATMAAVRPSDTSATKS